MAIIPTDFKLRFPEFVAIADARIQFFLDDAQLEVSEGAWEGLYEKGVFLLAAHLLYLDQVRQGADTDISDLTSGVTSRSVGDVSVSFARATATSVSDDWYLDTSYGAEYLRLKKRVGMGCVAVGDWR